MMNGNEDGGLENTGPVNIYDTQRLHMKLLCISEPYLVVLLRDVEWRRVLDLSAFSWN